jgi:Fe-S-cluster containining protein
MTALDAIYRQIPAFGCRPGCGDCCGLVPWSREEWARVADRAPAGVTLEAYDADTVIPMRGASTTCPFFSGGCTVYEDRPFMCRLFGTVRDARLTCPHGCRPDPLLSKQKADWLTMKYLRARKR